MTTTRHQFRVADLAYFPDDGNRYEVIEGELFVTAAPHSDHQAVVKQIEIALSRWDPEEERGWALAGSGVIFASDTGVIPDLVWVRSERLLAVLIDPATGERDGKLHAAPDLVVEVLSSGPENEERDRTVKRSLYSRRGVREYWIVDRFQQTVEVHRRTTAAMLELAATLLAEDTLTSPLLPGFSLPVVQIFRLPRALRP